MRLIAAQLVLVELDTTESGLEVALITVGELQGTLQGVHGALALETNEVTCDDA